MARSRFVRPECKVLQLSNGDTLTVKRRLNVGEERAMYARMSVLENNGRNVDPIAVGPAKVAAYLVNWSLSDDDGKLVEIQNRTPDEIEQVVNALDPVDFAEVRDAVYAHMDREEKARAEEKKLQAGAIGSSETSSSAGDSASNPPILTATSTT